MDTPTKQPLTKDEAILERRDILKMLNRHYQYFEQAKTDVSLMAQTYSQAGHDDLLETAMKYMEQIEASYMILHYLFLCMSKGKKRAIEQIQAEMQNGGD